MKKAFLLTALFLLVGHGKSFANERLVKRLFTENASQVKSLMEREVPHFDLNNFDLIVVDKDLIDNRGSLVDALGTKGRVELSNSSWLDFYRQGVDVRLLVLHELLRAHEINDDDYRVSLPLMKEIYEREDLTKARNTIPYCQLNVREYIFKEKKRKIKVYGDGSPMNSGRIVFPNPSAQEATDNAYRKGREECLKKGYERFKAYDGRTEMRNSFTNGFTKNITRTTLYGHCLKNVAKKRSRREIREAQCDKARQCAQDIEEYPETSGKEVRQSEVATLIGEQCS